MGKKKKTRQKTDVPSKSFEEALTELQEIVAELEEGSIGLEESMRRFEIGTALLRDCYKVLEKAEQRIEILTGVDADGNPLTATFNATATADDAENPVAKRKQPEPKNDPSDSADDNTGETDQTLF